MFSLLYATGIRVSELIKIRGRDISMSSPKHITFMDSSGIGMVMGRHRKMNFVGGRTFVTGIGDNVDRIFRMSGLYRIIPKYQERTEVL